MKLAIISDTHDNEANLQKALQIIEKEKIKTIIHCGDVSSFSFLKQNFTQFSTYVSLGNSDFNLQDYKNIKTFSKYGELGKIGFSHFPDIAEKLVKTNKYEFVFYGHTHKPWLKQKNNVIMANPGNLAGVFYRPSFAILKNKKLELKII